MGNMDKFKETVGQDFDNVTFYPLALDRSTPLKFRLGAYRDDGRFLEEVRLVRGYGQSDDLAWDASRPTEQWPGQHVYGGILFGHYGHFLLESLSRVASFRFGVPVVWHLASADPKERQRLFPWQQSIFNLLGVDTSTFRFVSATAVRIGSICVDRPGYVIPSEARAEHMKRLACFQASSVVPGRKIWLSRNKLVDQKRKVEGEAELERMLESAGWQIYSPERHPIESQLRDMTSAELLAGFMGSAFHTLILARNVATRLAIVTKGGAGNLNYTTIAQAMGLNQTIVTTPMEEFSKGTPRKQYRLQDIQGLFAALQRVEAAHISRVNA
jgi:capsular polysaccharide biosynthesis protein